MVLGVPAGHVFVVLSLIGLVVLPLALILGGSDVDTFGSFYRQIGSNNLRVLVGALIAGVVIDAVFFLRFWRYRDNFLALTPDAIVVFGFSIPWKYVETRLRGSVFVIHVTDQSAVDLRKIPWPYSSIYSYLIYRIVHYPRGEIRMPSWMFNVPIEQVLQAIETRKPIMTSAAVAEKAVIKAKGREYAKRGNMTMGIILTIGFFGYAAYLLLKGGVQAASTVMILMLLLGAYWYAIYSVGKK